MLEETRDWLDRAPLPLLPDPPNALLLLPLGLFGTRWLPTRSPPPRLPPTLPEPRLPMSRVPALGVRFPKVPACCCRPTFCRAFALAILHRLATSGAAVLARSLPVAVGRASTVLRVVLPVTVAPGRLISWAVASVSVVHVLPIAVVREDEAPGASIDSQARIWLDAAAALP